MKVYLILSIFAGQDLGVVGYTLNEKKAKRLVKELNKENDFVSYHYQELDQL